MDKIAALDELLAKLNSNQKWMQLSKQQLHKSTIVTKLAAVELALARLEADYDAITYRKNKLVLSCIEKAKQEIAGAFEALYEERAERAAQLMSAGWLHTDFGRQLLDAEAIEHHLGESDYLELTDAVQPWHARVERLFSMLEQEILHFRANVKSRAEE